VCVSIGEEPIETARHGHRRAWRNGRGPWLGLGRAGELATVSTCHLVVDGYGHACLTGRIHALTEAAAAARGGHAAGHNGTATHALPSAVHHADLAAPANHAAPVHPAYSAQLAPPAHSALHSAAHHAHPADAARAYAALPPLTPVAGAISLGIAWQALDDTRVRALPLAYAVGRILHRAAGFPDARFSPTLQIPVAPGRLDDPERRRCRAMAAIVSVRFDAGKPEPFDIFEARARAVLEREILGQGLCARLLAAARAAPTPITWKRRSFSTARPRWLDRISDVLGGRACLSRIRIDTPLPPACAVSSPSRHASADDPLGASVVTVVDDGSRAALTVCGSGLAGTGARARALLDEILDLAASPDLPRATSGIAVR
jgi:hypothetical protein